MMFGTELQDLMEVFNDLPFEVRGVGRFRENLVVKAEGGNYTPIGLDGDTDGGYVRTDGDITLEPKGNLTPTEIIYLAKGNFVCVVGTNSITNIDEVVCTRLAGVPLLKIKTPSFDKEQIAVKEKMEKVTHRDLFRVEFSYEFDYISHCSPVEILCEC